MGAALQVWCAGFLVRWGCSSRTAGSRVQELQELWHTGLVAPRHGDLSSRTRNRTRVLYIGRWILNHWTTRKASRLRLWKEK